MSVTIAVELDDQQSMALPLEWGHMSKAVRPKLAYVMFSVEQGVPAQLILLMVDSQITVVSRSAEN